MSEHTKPAATPAPPPDEDTALVLEALRCMAPDWFPEEPYRALAARIRAGEVRLISKGEEWALLWSIDVSVKEKLAEAERRAEAAERDGNALRAQVVALQDAIGGGGDTADFVARIKAGRAAEAHAALLRAALEERGGHEVTCGAYGNSGDCDCGYADALAATPAGAARYLAALLDFVGTERARHETCEGRPGGRYPRECPTCNALAAVDAARAEMGGERK